jgi:pentatricopeptide repeat protein
MNVVADQIKDGNDAEYQAEKQKVQNILGDKKYQLLSKMKMEGTNITLKYIGDEDAIDEVIVLASNEERGFALIRLLGNNMRPEKMMQLLNSMEQGDVNLDQLTGITKMFDM